MLRDMAKKPTEPKWRAQINELRTLREMTQSRLAEELGVSQATVWRLLHYEDQSIKLKTAEAIERVHGEAFDG